MGRPIDFTKFTVRKCQSLHVCDPCGEQITLGQRYYDGGYGRRAHVACIIRDAELLSEVSDLSAVNAHHAEEVKALRVQVDVCNQTIREAARKLRELAEADVTLERIRALSEEPMTSSERLAAIDAILTRITP